MSQELIYTSAPQGLKPGSRGFCTVISTQGMAQNLAETLESLSGYRHVFGPHDANARLNPVLCSHLKMTIGGRPYHILSRIADAGLDYTNRTNKFAHHVVLDRGETAPAGPAWLFTAPGFMEATWDGKPRVLPTGRRPAPGNVQSAPCRAWEALAGDAGWAGALAETVTANRPAVVVYRPGQDVLPLVAEALALLPPERRWEVTFSTYYTRLPPGVQCQWRFVIEGTPDAAAARTPQSLVINLSAPARAPNTSWTQAARSGQVPPELWRALQPESTLQPQQAEADVAELERELAADQENQPSRRAPPELDSVALGLAPPSVPWQGAKFAHAGIGITDPAMLRRVRRRRSLKVATGIAVVLFLCVLGAAYVLKFPSKHQLPPDTVAAAPNASNEGNPSEGGTKTEAPTETASSSDDGTDDKKPAGNNTAGEGTEPGGRTMTSPAQPARSAAGQVPGTADPPNQTPTSGGSDNSASSSNDSGPPKQPAPPMSMGSGDAGATPLPGAGTASPEALSREELEVGDASHADRSPQISRLVFPMQGNTDGKPREFDVDKILAARLSKLKLTRASGPAFAMDNSRQFKSPQKVKEYEWQLTLEPKQGTSTLLGGGSTTLTSIRLPNDNETRCRVTTYSLQGSLKHLPALLVTEGSDNAGSIILQFYEPTIIEPISPKLLELSELSIQDRSENCPCGMFGLINQQAKDRDVLRFAHASLDQLPPRFTCASTIYGGSWVVFRIRAKQATDYSLDLYVIARTRADMTKTDQMRIDLYAGIEIPEWLEGALDDEIYRSNKPKSTLGATDSKDIERQFKAAGTSIPFDKLKRLGSAALGRVAYAPGQGRGYFRSKISNEINEIARLKADRETVDGNSMLAPDIRAKNVKVIDSKIKTHESDKNKFEAQQASVESLIHALKDLIGQNAACKMNFDVVVNADENLDVLMATTRKVHVTANIVHVTSNSP